MAGKREDFRAEAALVSEELLREQGVEPFGELRGLGESLCVLIDPDGMARSRSLDRRTALIYILTCAQFAGVLSLGAWLANINAPDWLLGIMLGVMGVSGIGALLVFHYRKKWDAALLLDELRSRPNPWVPAEPLTPDGRPAYFVVDVQKRKGEMTFGLFRDDQAVLVPDPEHGCVLIESRGYRHVILGEDVDLLKAVANSGSVGVDVVYRVRDAEVPLHMFGQAMSGAVKSHFGIKLRNTLAQAVGEALAIE